MPKKSNDDKNIKPHCQDRDWNIRQKELGSVQNHVNKDGLKFSIRKWRCYEYGISAICCGIKNYLSALRAYSDLPWEQGDKKRKKKKRNAIVRYIRWCIFISDRAILLSVTARLDSNETAIVSFNSNCPLLPEHHYCFNTELRYLPTTDL